MRLLLLLLSAARATAYGYGEDVTSCWATRPGQDTAELEDCQGADVLWGATGPSDNSALSDTSKLLSSTAYQVTYRAVVPQNLTGYQLALDVSHGNIHSCLRNVGFCTPFVTETKGLSTHSPAQTGKFELGGGVFRSNLTTELKLEEGTYTVIAHFRWFETNGTQHDMARSVRSIVRSIVLSDEDAGDPSRNSTREVYGTATEVSSESPGNKLALLISLIVVPMTIACLLVMVLLLSCRHFSRLSRDMAQIRDSRESHSWELQMISHQAQQAQRVARSRQSQLARSKSQLARSRWHLAGNHLGPPDSRLSTVESERWASAEISTASEERSSLTAASTSLGQRSLLTLPPGPPSSSGLSDQWLSGESERQSVPVPGEDLWQPARQLFRIASGDSSFSVKEPGPRWPERLLAKAPSFFRRESLKPSDVTPQAPTIASAAPANAAAFASAVDFQQTEMSERLKSAAASGRSSAPLNAPPKKGPPKRPAPAPESASARPAKKTFTSPYHEFCQQQRPLLMPLGMANRDRERLIGQYWKALPEAEKAKYKVGLTKLPVSGRGGTHAWAPTSAQCLQPALTTTGPEPGRVHPPLSTTPAQPPTRATPSAAPNAPPVAPPPLPADPAQTFEENWLKNGFGAAPAPPPAAPPTLPADVAQMFEEPVGLGAAPAAPPAPSMAPTASSSSWPENSDSLGSNLSPPRSSTAAVAVPVAKPAGFRWAASLADLWAHSHYGPPQAKSKRASSSSSIDLTADQLGEKPQFERANSSSSSSTSSSTVYACPRTLAASSSSWLEQQQLTEEMNGRMTGSEAIEVAVEEAMLELGNSDHLVDRLDEVIEETVMESNAIMETIEEAIEEHRVETETVELMGVISGWG